MAGFHVVLDPSEVAVNRTEFKLNEGPIRIDQAGLDWGDATITAFMADLAVGSVPVDYRLPNRNVKIPLFLGADESGQLDSTRRALQQKVALIQREGGWVKRQSGLYGDVVNAVLNVPDIWGETGGLEDKVVLTLECLPDFYGDEVALDSLTGTGTVTGVLKQAGVNVDIPGDHPARCRLVVADTSGNDQRGLLLGVRSRYQDSASTAALAYEAEALTPQPGAASIALTGASGGNAVRYPSLPLGNWVPVLSTDIGGSPLTHKGSYRVVARVYTTIGDNDNPPVSFRFSWQVGDGQSRVNQAKQLQGPNSFYLLDLGEVILNPAPSGAHYWRGMLQAMGGTGTPRNIYVDKLLLIPLDETYCKLKAPLQILATDPIVAWDDLGLANGVALNGRTAPLGGNWATSAPEGSHPTDFTGDGNGEIQRTVNSEAVDLLGRVGVLPTVYTETEASVDLRILPGSYTGRTPAGGALSGLVVRYNAGDCFFIHVDSRQMTNWEVPAFAIMQIVGGSWSYLNFVYLPPTVIYSSGQAGFGPWLTIAVRATAAGQITATLSKQGSPTPLYSLSASSGQGTTVGGLVSGKVGIHDVNFELWTSTARQFANFLARDPTASVVAHDAVMFGHRNAELRSEGHWRQSNDGVASVPISEQVGDLPRLPPGGLEARAVDLVARSSRGDLDQLPDDALDGLSVTPYYRPCYIGRP